MKAPIYAHPSESCSSVESLFGYRASRQLVNGKAPRLAARRASNHGSGERGAAPSFTTADPTNLSAIWSSLLELLPQGVIVLSRSLQPVYWNSKAEKLCQGQMGGGLPSHLPQAISEACHRLLRESEPNSAALFVKDEQNGQACLRISTRWLVSVATQQCLFPANSVPSMPQYPATHQDPVTQGSASADPAYIAIFLENCDEVLEQEMRIQQKKYDLTERESEICMLLRREYTYQEIAKVLQISLNTVKTHVKNIYAKRRSYQGEEKVLVL